MNREERILRRSEDLFMRYGIRSVTMDDIARDLGISKKTLYQHVDNKADLVDRITESYIQGEKQCLAEISANAKDAIDQQLMIARHVVQILRRMRPTTMFDLKKYYRECWEKMDRFHLGYVYRVIRSNIEQGIYEGLYRQNLDPDIIAKLYVGKTMILNDEEMFPLREYNRDDLFVQYINYHLRGILSDKGGRKLKTYQPLS